MSSFTNENTQPGDIINNIYDIDNDIVNEINQDDWFLLTCGKCRFSSYDVAEFREHAYNHYMDTEQYKIDTEQYNMETENSTNMPTNDISELPSQQKCSVRTCMVSNCPTSCMTQEEFDAENRCYTCHIGFSTVQERDNHWPDCTPIPDSESLYWECQCCHIPFPTLIDCEAHEASVWREESAAMQDTYEDDYERKYKNEIEDSHNDYDVNVDGSVKNSRKT
jgi:hypothetical protein